LTYTTVKLAPKYHSMRAYLQTSTVSFQNRFKRFCRLF